MSYTFPNIAVPEKEKRTEEYHRKWATAVCSTTFTGDWALGYNKMRVLYSFFLEGTGNDLTTYLTTAPDGSAMPGIWTSQNSVRTRMRELLGEFEERSYLIKARAVNAEAQARKLEERERLRIKRKLGPLAQEIEEETGIPMESPEYVPQTDEELREYMDLSWKDKNVLILEGALKWTALRNNDDETRKREILNQLIANISVVCNEIVNGVNRIRSVDPLKFGFDTQASSDILHDASYFYEFDYQPLAEVAQRYGLTEDELKQSCGNYNNGAGIGKEVDPGWGCMPGQVNPWYRVENGMQRALVIKICWKDYKTLSHKSEVKEEYGTEIFQDVSEDDPRERDKDKIVYNKIECWRQATLIGGQFVREWGECPNQPRELSSLQLSHPPYEVWINEFLQGKRVSMVEQLVGLQLLKDIALYQLQIQMARAVGKVLIFDEAMMPEGETKESVMRRLKADGVAFVNTREYQQNTGSMNLFQEYDLGLSQTITQGIQLIEYFDRQMDATSGVSPERQGQIQGSSVSTGTTTAALVQSGMTTASLFKGFERFWSRVLQQQARLVKIAWVGKEKFSPIIGDVGVDFLRDNIDISLDEFDVVVQSLPPTTIDRQTLVQWLTFAVQSDPEFLSDAMDIMLEPDTTQAVRIYQRKMKLRKRLMAQQAQQEQQSMAEEAQAQRDHEAQLQQGDWQNQQAIESEKVQGSIKKQILGGRVKLTQTKLGLFK